MNISSAGRSIATVAPRSGFPLPVKLVAGGVAALVVGSFAYAGYKLIQGATTGVKPEAAQKSAFKQLDHSRDGVIQLDASIKKQEFVRFTSHDGLDDNTSFDDYWTVDDESSKLVAADADQDGSVTAEEYQALLLQYDRNGNGKLNFGDLSKLERAHPSVEVHRQGSYPGFDYPYVPSTPLPTGPGDSGR